MISRQDAPHGLLVSHCPVFAHPGRELEAQLKTKFIGPIVQRNDYRMQMLSGDFRFRQKWRIDIDAGNGSVQIRRMHNQKHAALFACLPAMCSSRRTPVAVK